MAVRKESRVAAALNQGYPLAGFQGLHRNLCFVPTVTARSRCEREQNLVASWEKLGTVSRLVRVDRYYCLRFSTVGRNAHDAIWPESDQDMIGIVPIGAIRIGEIADRDVGAAGQRDLLQF